MEEKTFKIKVKETIQSQLLCEAFIFIALQQLFEKINLPSSLCIEEIK